MIRMTWKGFEDKYKFEEHDGSNMVETDSSRVKEIEDKYGDNAWRYIWTWCSEGSDEYFVAGYACVNRMNYMIATVPHDLEEDESVEIVEDYDELARRPKNSSRENLDKSYYMGKIPLNISKIKLCYQYCHYAKFDLWMDNELKIVEIFAEQNIDGYAWFSLAIDGEVMETSEYKDWSPDEEDEKGEFDFDKLAKTELMGNRYLGRDTIADTVMRSCR